MGWALLPLEILYTGVILKMGRSMAKAMRQKVRVRSQENG